MQLRYRGQIVHYKCVCHHSENVKTKNLNCNRQRCVSHTKKPFSMSHQHVQNEVKVMNSDFVSNILSIEVVAIPFHQKWIIIRRQVSSTTIFALKQAPSSAKNHPPTQKTRAKSLRIKSPIIFCQSYMMRLCASFSRAVCCR